MINGQLKLSKHDFAEKPVEESHSGAFVSQCTLNYVPEAVQSQFIQNIYASLETGAPILLDLFYPISITQPEAVNQWQDHGSFSTDKGTVNLRVKRWMTSGNIERRIREFKYADGRIVKNDTARIYISPDKAKKILEDTGFKEIYIIRKYDRSTKSQNFTSRSNEDNNFVLVGYKK